MGAFQQGFGYGQQLNQNAFQREEEQRIANRDAMANLHQQILQSPDSTPDQRQQALTAIVGLYKPHEAPGLMQRLSGLIHGQAQQTAQAQQVAQAAAQQPAEPVQPPAPIVRDPLGIPYSDAAEAQAASQPIHPMQSDHPVLNRFNQALDALGNHLKGFAQPVPPTPQPNMASEFSNYKSPEQINRESADLALQRSLQAGQQRGEFGVEQAKIRARGSSGEARYISAYADSLGKDPAELTPDEYQTGIQQYADSKRRPQTIVDPRTGVVNLVKRDDEGNPIAAPMLDANGHEFGGFKPNTVTVKNGVYHFIGADEQVHEVPVTTTTTKVFGPHVAAEDKPMPITPAKVKEGETGPQSPQIAEPDVPSLAEINAKATAAKLNKKRSQSRQVPVSAPAGTTPTPSFPGKTLGQARIPAAEKGVLEGDQQIQTAVQNVLPSLDSLKNKNSIADKGKMLEEWGKYQAGFAPDPPYDQIIKNVALLQTVGASTWTRIGRNRYTFDVIQKHLPRPTDTPKMLYDKIKWLSTEVIPSSVNAMRNPNGPSSSNAPQLPTESGKPAQQSLADRLNEALRGK